MAIAKKVNWESIFIFLFLAIFPFGQIIRIGILQPIDIVVGIAALYSIIKKLRKPEIFKYFDNFLLFAAFSWVISVFVFRRIEIAYGLLYLFRLAAYFYFLINVWHFAKQKKENKSLLVDSLLLVAVVSAVFGWVQYFRFPDIKPFFTWGWDEHLFRLVGTFLDPAFLGLIIIFGSIIAIYNKRWFLTLFLTVSLAFTYSRASFLAFASAILVIGYYQNIIKKLVPWILGLFILAALLPTTKNHSIELLRSFSALSRLENYQETMKVFKTSPVFGIGFNNMCLARRTFIGPESFSSHACSGSDSSLLFVLATTGMAGLFGFLLLALNIWKRSTLSLKSMLIALSVHSLFSNSVFYPWILGYLLILLAVSLRSEV